MGLMAIMEYLYRGDRLRAPELKGALCRAVRNSDGKCIRGANGNMLVEFENGVRCVALGRQLRRLDRLAR